MRCLVLFSDVAKSVTRFYSPGNISSVCLSLILGPERGLSQDALKRRLKSGKGNSDLQYFFIIINIIIIIIIIITIIIIIIIITIIIYQGKAVSKSCHKWLPWATKNNK